MSQAKKQDGLKEILKAVRKVNKHNKTEHEKITEEEIVWILSRQKIKAVIKKHKEKEKTTKDEEDLEIKVKGSKSKKGFNLYSSLVDNFYFMEHLYGQMQSVDYSRLYSHMGNASVPAFQQLYEAAAASRGDKLGEKEIISEKEIESCIVGYACVRVLGANETDMNIDMRERFKYWKELNKWKLEMKMRYTATWA